MFLFKSCPRCKGDLYSDHDLYGAYLTCVQCGYTHDYLAGPPEQNPRKEHTRHIVRGSLKWSYLGKHTLPR